MKASKLNFVSLKNVEIRITASFQSKIDSWKLPVNLCRFIVWRAQILGALSVTIRELLATNYDLKFSKIFTFLFLEFMWELND